MSLSDEEEEEDQLGGGVMEQGSVLSNLDDEGDGDYADDFAAASYSHSHVDSTLRSNGNVSTDGLEGAGEVVEVRFSFVQELFCSLSRALGRGIGSGKER